MGDMKLLTTSEQYKRYKKVIIECWILKTPKHHGISILEPPDDHLPLPFFCGNYPNFILHNSSNDCICILTGSSG